MTQNFKVQIVGGGTADADFHNNTITMFDGEGRTVKLDLTPADVHIDSALPNYCAGYKLQGAIADIVVPVVPTPKASDYFYTWDKDDAFQDVEALAGGALDNPKEISPTLSSTRFQTQSYCLAAPVAAEVVGNADAPVRPEVAAMRLIMNKLMLARERRAAALLMTTTNWGSGRYAAVTAKWNGGSGSNPIQDIYTGIESALDTVNQIVMSEQVYHDFVQNAQVQKYIASKTAVTPIAASNSAQASELSALLGLPPIVIAPMKGKTSSGYGYVWGGNVALCHNEPGVPADGMSINTAKTFRWTGADGTVADGANQTGFLVRRYWDPRRGARGAWVYVVAHNDAEVLTSSYVGYLLTGAHA